MVDVLALERGADLPPGPDNPRGFFESHQLTSFNDQLLAALGGDWCHPPLTPPPWSEPPLLDCITAERQRFAPYALGREWLDKDPRLCITLPAIQHLLLRRVPVLVALRDPLQVAASLRWRNGFDLERGLALWFLYNHHLAVSLQDSDHLITYTDLLAASAESVRAAQLLDLLAPFLEVHGHRAPSPVAWRQILATRVEAGLNRAAQFSVHPQSDANGISPQLAALVSDAYQQAVEGVAGHRQAFAALPWPILELCGRLRLCAPGVEQQQRCQHLLRELDDCRRQLVEQQQQMQALRSSTSWQSTAPLRWLLDRRRR